MKKIKISKINIILIVLIVIAFVLVSEVKGFFKQNQQITINIAEGTSLTGLAKTLKEHDLINSEILFKLFAKTQDDIIKSGDHVFTDRSYKALYESACKSVYEGVDVTIPEGMEFYRIAKLLSDKGLGTYEEFIEAGKIKYYDYWFLKDLPQRKYELEGYLFPDTYNFSYHQSPQEIFDMMLNNFNVKFTDDMKKRADEINMSVDEIITLASIVEREAAVKNELDIVAGVFYNRLNQKAESTGLLESCATVQYILEERKDVLSMSDTKIDSPYNTYMYKGLPVGPISQPGMSAISATLYPKKTDYLYFVADGTGKHLFSKTFTEHTNNMRKVGL